MKNPFPPCLVRAVLLTGLISLGATKLFAQASTGWSGGGPDGFWSTAANWTNGVPNSTTNSSGQAARILNFGVTGNAHPSSTNDMNGVSTHRIFFNSGATNYTLYLKTATTGTTLNDFSQNQPQIQNDSTNLQTVDMPFKMQGKGVTIVANRAANINPTSGDLLFTTNCVITIIQDTQLRFFSSAGHAVFMYAPIVQSGFSNGCVLATTASVGSGATVIFYNTNSSTNLVINCGTARFATNVMSAPIVLGDSNTNNAPATLQMDNGFSNFSTLTTLMGSTNFRTIGNTAFGAGTADFAGPITLGTNMVTSANPAGLLEFDGNVDFQNPSGTGPRTLSVSGSGNTLFTGSFTNASTGSSVLTKTNSGTLTIAGTNNANRILFNLGGGTIAITNGSAIGIPTGVNYPDKFNFTANATLSVTNSFTLGRNVSSVDNAGFRIAAGVTGNFDVAAGSTLTIDGPITNAPGGNSGNLTKVGAGTLLLQQPNAYGGLTTVNNGVLALGGSGSISNTANIIIAANATFDVSASSPAFALGSSQTLTANGGTGNIAGNLNLNTGSVVLNYTNGTPSLQVSGGQLSFNNNSVTVTVTGSSLAAGSYRLISAGSGGSVGGSVALASLTVNGAGFAAGAQVSLKITGGELFLVVNHSPTTTPLNLTRNSGTPVVKIFFSDLATNWSDADGDTMSLVSVGNSTNGVVITTNGGFLVYNNPNNVADQFTYIITDAQGATASGVVNIAVIQDVAGQMQSFAVIAGSPTLTFAGIPSYSYSVERSTNLPVWVTIWTTNAPSGGVFDFTDDFSDLGGVPPSSAFYRLSWQH